LLRAEEGDVLQPGERPTQAGWQRRVRKLGQVRHPALVDPGHEGARARIAEPPGPHGEVQLQIEREHSDVERASALRRLDGVGALDRCAGPLGLPEREQCVEVGAGIMEVVIEGALGAVKLAAESVDGERCFASFAQDGEPARVWLRQMPILQPNGGYRGAPSNGCYSRPNESDG